MRILKILAKSKSPEILLALREGELNFGAVAQIAGDRATAMRRLRELIECGMVERREVGDRVGTVKYRLTEKGRKVVSAVIQISRFDNE